MTTTPTIPTPAAVQVPKVEDLLVMAVEAGLIRMSKMMDTDLQDALTAFSRALLSATPAAPAAQAASTLTDERIKDLACEWVYIRPGRESEQYEELRDFARAVLKEASAMTPAAPREELDAWKCERCDGKGEHWEMCQVGERKSDQQECKVGCRECDELGWIGPDAELAAAASLAKEKP